MHLLHSHQHRFYLLALGVIIAVLVVSNIAVSASLSTSGEHIRELEQQRDLLTEQNQDLKRSLLNHSSLLSLSSKAEALGFTTPKDIISIDLDSPVAMSR